MRPIHREQASRSVRQRWRETLWRHRWPLLFVSPFFVLFAVFNMYPIVFSLWLSLHDWPGLGPMEFIGLANYAELSHDSIFWNSMLNAAILFFVYVPLMTFLAVVNEEKDGRVQHRVPEDGVVAEL